MSTLIAMALFALVTSISPGPVNILATMSGARVGVRQNIWFVLGASIGFCSILIIVGAGLGRIMQSNIVVATLLSVIGSVYLLYLAYVLSQAKISIQFDSTDSVKPPHFWQGVLLQYTNPKAWLVSMSGLAMFLADTQNYMQDLLSFVLIFFAVCFGSILAWVWAGYFLSKYFSSKAILLFNKTMAGLLAFLVLMDLYRTFVNVANGL